MCTSLMSLNYKHESLLVFEKIEIFDFFPTKLMARLYKGPFLNDVSIYSMISHHPPTSVIMSAWNDQFYNNTHLSAFIINKTKKNKIMIEIKCKKHSHGTASAFVIKKSVSRHHPPTCQHEMKVFRPPTHLIVRRH